MVLMLAKSIGARRRTASRSATAISTAGRTIASRPARWPLCPGPAIAFVGWQSVLGQSSGNVPNSPQSLFRGLFGAPPSEDDERELCRKRRVDPDCPWRGRRPYRAAARV